MNKKICKVIFGMLVFSLIFNNIPKPIQLNFLGGPVGSKLVVYPLIAAFAYTFYCQYKYKNVFVDIKPFLKYTFVFISIMLLSTVVGLFNYSYYDLVLNGPVNQIEKLPKVLAFCHAHGIDVDSKLLMKFWIIVRQLKGVLLEAFWCFGGTYIIYCWYKDDWRKALNICVKGVMASLAIIVVYCSIEIFYLGGNLIAKSILSAIIPYIHIVKTSHNWWPPLLWKGQLRMVFPEPSHVGNYIAFLLPLLWYKYFSVDNTRWKVGLLSVATFLAFCIFLTKARTAYAMFFGTIFLFFLLILWSKEYTYLKQFIAILICTSIGFGLFLGFSSLKNCKENKVQDSLITNIATSAIEDNFTSLAYENKRSNGARYALLHSSLKIAVQHPMLGVGNGLISAYIVENFSKADLRNKEVAMWVKNQKNYGPFSAGYSIGGAMNEYFTRLVQNGLIGLAVHIFPFTVVIYRMLRCCRENTFKYRMEFVCVLTALISSLVAGFNGSINVFYCVWVLLGLSYAMSFGTSKKKKESNESA